jgi:hypothetical protein
MRPVANIAVANVGVNLPDMEQNFSVNAGLGGMGGMGGMGGGSLLGGTRGNIGMGLSDVSVFGLNSYKIIKDEITDMVGNLSAGTLLNPRKSSQNPEDRDQS